MSEDSAAQLSQHSAPSRLLRRNLFTPPLSSSLDRIGSLKDYAYFAARVFRRIDQNSIVPYFSPQPSACRFLGTRLGLLHAGLCRFRKVNALPAFRVWHQRVFSCRAAGSLDCGRRQHHQEIHPVLGLLEERSRQHLWHLVLLCHSST